MNAFSPFEVASTGRAHVMLHWCSDEAPRHNTVAPQRARGAVGGSHIGLNGPEGWVAILFGDEARRERPGEGYSVSRWNCPASDGCRVRAYFACCLSIM